MAAKIFPGRGPYLPGADPHPRAFLRRRRLHVSCMRAFPTPRKDGSREPGIAANRNRRRRQLRVVLVQGLTYYRDTPDDGVIPGLMNLRVGRYHVRDVEVASA